MQLLFAHVQHKPLEIIICQAQEGSYHISEVTIAASTQRVLLCHVRLGALCQHEKALRIYDLYSCCVWR